MFEGHTKPVGMGRKNEIGTVAVVVERGGLQIGGIKAFGVHDRARHVPKNQKLLGRKAQVVAIGGTTEAEHRRSLVLGIQMADQGRLKRFKHAFCGLLVDPAVVFQHDGKET